MFCLSIVKGVLDDTGAEVAVGRSDSQDGGRGEGLSGQAAGGGIGGVWKEWGPTGGIYEGVLGEGGSWGEESGLACGLGHASGNLGQDEQEGSC